VIHQNNKEKSNMTAVKTYLYKRPAHNTLTITSPDPSTGTPIVRGRHLVSAFAGIDMAVRAVAMNGQNLVEVLRIIRKLEKAMHREVALHAQYVEFTTVEKKIITDSILQFPWSRNAQELGHNLWIMWTSFLEGFDDTSDTYASTWLEYDPMNPPEEYATWKIKHAQDIATWESKVKEAEEAAAAKAASSKEPEPLVSGDFTQDATTPAA
jgi:hypothetical protein